MNQPGVPGFAHQTCKPEFENAVDLDSLVTMHNSLKTQVTGTANIQSKNYHSSTSLESNAESATIKYQLSRANKTHAKIKQSNSTQCIIITRHSLVERRARYLVYCMFVCLFVCSVNDFSATRGPIHAIFCMRA